MKSGFLKKLLDRANKIDKQQILDYMVDIAQERDMMFFLFDSMVEGMTFINEEGKVIYINKSARAILNLGDGPITPELSFDKIFFDSDLLALCRRGIHSQEHLIFRDYTMDIGGIKRVLRINIIPLANAQKRFGTMFLFLDQTEQKAQEKKLREAEKLAALTTLTAGVSHEIRNPLNAMSIHLQLLKRNLSKKGIKDEDTENILSIFTTEIERLNHVIESFLSTVRPAKPKFLLVNLYSLVTETLNLMEPEFLENHIRVSLHEEGNWPLVEADETQLKQAFINILRNAVEAVVSKENSSKEKEVRLFLYRNENEVSLVFEDTGKGIPEGDLAQIFDPYFTNKPKGTGLGLMLVERIVREHKGQVNASSEVGIGTQITVTLPVAAESPKLLEHEKTHAK